MTDMIDGCKAASGFGHFSLGQATYLLSCQTESRLICLYLVSLQPDVSDAVIFGDLLRRATMAGGLRLVVLLSLLVAFASATNLKIASWNIQNFGKSFMSQRNHVNNAVNVVRRYHLICIQEISDIDEVAFPQLLAEVNDGGPGDYQMVMSARVGSGGTAEQYGCLFRSSFLRVIFQDEYDGRDRSKLIRDPHLVRFQSVSSRDTFGVINMHTSPSDEGVLITELQALHRVITQAQTIMDEENVILMGDLNSGFRPYCKSSQALSAEEAETLKLFSDPQLHVWIRSGIHDTTVRTGDNNNCAYDRFITTKGFTERVLSGSARVAPHASPASTALDYSDHYPIELEYTITSRSWRRIYYERFESGYDEEWSWDRAGGPPTSPVPQSTNDFLGRFGGRDLVRFKPSSTILPREATSKDYRITFDLFIIGSWNGDGSAGPDTIKVLRDRTRLMEASFCNLSGRQSYPSGVGDGSNPCKTGSVSVNTLGSYDGQDENDAVYKIDLQFTIPSRYSMEFRISGELLSTTGYEPIEAESWGIDNVELYYAEPVPAQSSSAVPSTTAVAMLTIGDSKKRGAMTVTPSVEALKLQIAALAEVPAALVIVMEAQLQTPPFEVVVQLPADGEARLENLLATSDPLLRNTFLEDARVELVSVATQSDEEESETVNSFKTQAAETSSLFSVDADLSSASAAALLSIGCCVYAAGIVTTLLIVF